MSLGGAWVAEAGAVGILFKGGGPPGGGVLFTQGVWAVNPPNNGTLLGHKTGLPWGRGTL